MFEEAPLDPRSREMLIAQQLKRANILRATTPVAHGEYVGGIYPHYVPPIADWTANAFNKLDAKIAEEEASSALQQLNVDREAAINDFTKRYANVDPTNDSDKPRIWNALLETINNPYLEDSKAGSIFGSLLRPPPSMFPTTLTETGQVVTRRPNGGATVERVPEIADPYEQRRREEEASKRRAEQRAIEADRRSAENTKADNDRAEKLFEYQKSEAELNRKLREAQLEETRRAASEREQRQREQDTQKRIDAFVRTTDKLAPAYTAAQQAQQMLARYPNGDIPGLGLLAAAKAAAGGLGMSPEEKSNRATMDALQEFFQLYATGAAAPSAQAARIASEIGKDTFESVANFRANYPRIAEFFDTLNKHHRSILGTPEEAQRLLEEKGSPFATFITPSATTSEGQTESPTLKVLPATPPQKVLVPAMDEPDSDADYGDDDPEPTPAPKGKKVTRKGSIKLPNGKTIYYEETP